MSVGFVGIDAGGTTFKIAYAPTEDIRNVTVHHSVPTTESPVSTLAAVVAFIRQLPSVPRAIGVASFGPLDLTRESPTYGHITTTPKPGWQFANVLGPLRAAFPGMPIGFDTDVNAAAVGELRHGNHGDDVSSIAYITVGTGVGVGLVINRQSVTGLLHPEMGHVKPPLHAADVASGFTGTCPFHGECIEGLVSTGALCKRFGVAADALAALPDDDERWNVVAFYLANLCATLTLTVSPHKIVISGGVMNRRSLFPRIRKQFLASINGYLKQLPILETDSYIVPSPFGDTSGGIGALQLAVAALEHGAAK
jgi:fructokinase